MHYVWRGQGQALNARLILLLANHIGDLRVLREALAAARQPAAPTHPAAPATAAIAATPTAAHIPAQTPP